MSGAIVPNVPIVPGEKIIPPAFPWPDDDDAGVDAGWDEVTVWDVPSSERRTLRSGARCQHDKQH